MIKEKTIKVVDLRGISKVTPKNAPVFNSYGNSEEQGVYP